MIVKALIIKDVVLCQQKYDKKIKLKLKPYTCEGKGPLARKYFA